jgi:sterol desaturase/sphingolipid hydroxylase (fatty acid hydroxylase superfamily)
MFLFDAMALFVIIALRYFLVAGGAYLVFWRWGRHRFAARKIQAGIPPISIRRLEIRYSLISSAVFAVAGAFVHQLWQGGHTRIYLAVSDYGWAYTLFSLPLLLFLHDAYFYFTHRLMHHPRLFARMHRVHHESRNPSPWAAFSFHPTEAAVEAAVFPLLICVVPIHLAVLFLFLGIMTVLSVINHLGYELYSFELPGIISATNHDLHHRDVRVNYGLYFTIWDDCLGTRSSGARESDTRRRSPRGDCVETPPPDVPESASPPPRARAARG